MNSPQPLDYHRPEYRGPSFLERALHLILVVGGVAAGMYAGLCVAGLCVYVLIDIYGLPTRPGVRIGESMAIGIITLALLLTGGFVGGRAGIWFAARLGVARPSRP